jgi:putative transposase
MTTHRRVARLEAQNYFGRQSYFVTICCNHRVSYLREETMAQRVLTLLLECAASHAFRLHAFCLMPDHVHVLAEGTHDRCDLREFIRLFKQRTAFEFRKSHRPTVVAGLQTRDFSGSRCGEHSTASATLWEMSYYDHVLRPSDAIEDVACYIWWNPVRQGLCACPHQFPYSGSQTIDWIKRSSSAPIWSAPWKRP